MIYGVTYSDDKMRRSANLCLSSMLENGVQRVTGYNPAKWNSWDYEDTFSWLNKETLACERGGGFWLWKSWCIAHKMSEMNDGDILIYADAGIEFVNSVHHIIDRMDQDIFFFTNGFSHVEWCKGDVLREILGWGLSQEKTNCGVITKIDWLALPYNEQKQVQASVIFFKVNQNTRNFVKEWLLYCQMPGFIDDSPSKLSNYPTFAEHRHDQAILTCLQIKHGYKLHFWPTAYSEHIRHTALPEDNYPTMFNHHRFRDKDKGNGEPEWPQDK